MITNRAEEIINELDQKDSVLHRPISCWCSDDINDLQRTRALLLDCLLYMKKDPPTQLWETTWDLLIMLGYPQRQYTMSETLPETIPALMWYRDILLDALERIKTILVV